MTREEGEALIEKALDIAHSSMLEGLGGKPLAELARLARLGLRVEAPSEEEIEQVAWVLCKQQLDDPQEHDYFEWDDVFPETQERLKSEARAAYAAIVERYGK